MTTSGSNHPGGLGERMLSLFWGKLPATLAERTRRRVSLHLIPYLFFLYILAYLDRVNVSVAELAMRGPLDQGGMGFDTAITGFGAGIFFWGYWILEIPSTVSVVRWGARWVFVRILILWGICAALVGTIGTPFAASLFAWLPHVAEQSAFVDSVDGWSTSLLGWLVRLLSKDGTVHPALSFAQYFNGLHDSPAYQFYFFRFMLGFFEGGFFPSVIVYLSHWFRTQDRAKAIASFMAAIPISSMIGLPLSRLFLNVHWLQLAGWRWIFIVEGIAPILAGFATLFFLPNRPADAKWLPADERDWLLAELEQEHQTKQGQGHGAWRQHLGMVLLLTVVYFCLNVSSYGLSMFMPAIIKSQLHVSNELASLLAGLPYVMGLIGMLVNGWHSDRTGERPWHAAVPLALLGLSIYLTAALDSVPVVPALVMIFCVGICMYAHLPAFWPIPTLFLGAFAAASAIGFINMVGNLGGSVGPMMVGELARESSNANASESAKDPAEVKRVKDTPVSGMGEANHQSSASRPSQDRINFAPALNSLAPWPLVGAAIILIVGYTRRKVMATGRAAQTTKPAG